MATIKLEIDKNTKFPQVVHTWELRKEGKKIVALSSSRAEGADRTVFPYREGFLFLYNSAHKKYAYFRDRVFQDFLDRNLLTTVKKQNPNQSYEVREHNSGDGHRSYKIETDGRVETVRDGGFFDGPPSREIGNACYSGDYTVTVSSASWVTLEEFSAMPGSHNFSKVLYTLEKIKNLKIA